GRPSAGRAEPPLHSPGQRAPKVMESRHVGGVAAGQTPETKPVPETDRCKVGFWNVTGRDVTLTINGQARRLPRDRAVTLDLGHKFVWQLDQREPRSEVVPAEQATFEVVLRR